MTDLDSIGIWQVVDKVPMRLASTALDSERELEDWIVRDPAFLERGLVIVGRQLRLEGGPLDLLALDPQGRWVLVEIKRERLRRDVLAQAIDYASCLVDLDPAWLRDQCDTYLRAQGRAETLDVLLSARGRSLEAEADGRDVVIYLVGTGFDPGLERMVSFLTERAELSVRIVTFSAFRDTQGGLLLARGIHESAESPATPQSRKAPTPEAVLALADANGVGSVMRSMYDTAMQLGLHPRTNTRSIMFAPPANKTRCLYVVWVDRQRQGPGVAKVWITPEAFERFYGIDEARLIAAVGKAEEVMLDEAGAQRVNAGIRELLESNISTPAG